MGAPQFAVPILFNLFESGRAPVAIDARAPAPGGRRGLDIRKTLVHLAADSLGIPVFTPHSWRDVEIQSVFSGLAADVVVVAAYGLMLPIPILESPRWS